MSLKLGEIIDDRYRVMSRIGHGGMAEVYEGQDIITRKIVAIKLIREDIMSDPVNVQRFKNEATIAASLSHPNIVKVLSHGTHVDRPYIVHEYIKGQNIKETIDFRGRLDTKEAVEVMLQLTDALQYAHERNIIHRDIKPDNLFLMPDGSIKLSDFGIAEMESIETCKGKKTEIVGSVHYLAPEISEGKPASPLSDIYSAGITFYELLTGHVPFFGDDAVNVAVAHIKEKMPSVKKYVPTLPKEIDHIIFMACNKDPKKRYQSCSQFHDELLDLKNHPELLKEKKGLLSKIFGFK